MCFCNMASAASRGSSCGDRVLLATTKPRLRPELNPSVAADLPDPSDRTSPGADESSARKRSRRSVKKEAMRRGSAAPAPRAAASLRAPHAEQSPGRPKGPESERLERHHTGRMAKTRRNSDGRRDAHLGSIGPARQTSILGELAAVVAASLQALQSASTRARVSNERSHKSPCHWPKSPASSLAQTTWPFLRATSTRRSRG